jgi:GTPase SAR1 family protein
MASSSVNILIAGDVKSGKTSLINTFISSTFSEEVTAGNLEVKIPQESVLYRKHVNILDCHGE